MDLKLGAIGAHQQIIIRYHGGGNIIRYHGFEMGELLDQINKIS